MSVLSWGAPVRSAVDCLSVSLAGSWLVDRLVDLPDGWLATRLTIERLSTGLVTDGLDDRLAILNPLD